jgi:hypothetical protein
VVLDFLRPPSVQRYERKDKSAYGKQRIKQSDSSTPRPYTMSALLLQASALSWNLPAYLILLEHAASTSIIQSCFKMASLLDCSALVNMSEDILTKKGAL